MSETALAKNILIHPTRAGDDDAPMRRIGFWKARAFETGIIMENTDTPRGWNFNPSNIAVIISLILLALFLLGGVGSAFWYMSTQASQIQNLERRLDDATKGAYDKGKSDAEKVQLEERLKALEKEKQAEEFNKRHNK